MESRWGRAPERAAAPGSEQRELLYGCGRPDRKTRSPTTKTQRKEERGTGRFDGRALGHVALLAVVALVAAACGSTQTAQAPHPQPKPAGRWDGDDCR